MDYILDFKRFMAAHKWPEGDWKEIFVAFCCTGKAKEKIKIMDIEDMTLEEIWIELQKEFPSKSQLDL